jgi:hypothetical protein
VRFLDFRYVGGVDKKLHLDEPPHGSQSVLVLIQVVVPAFWAAKAEIPAPDGVLDTLSAGEIDLAGRAFDHHIVDLARAALDASRTAGQALAEPGLQGAIPQVNQQNENNQPHAIGSTSWAGSWISLNSTAMLL